MAGLDPATGFAASSFLRLSGILADPLTLSSGETGSQVFPLSAHRDRVTLIHVNESEARGASPHRGDCHGRRALSQTRGDMEANSMTVDEYRAMADRCRELLRVAVRDDIRSQLRQWAEDLDAEADALDGAADYSTGTNRRSFERL